MDTSENNIPAHDGSAFTKTHWSIVLSAAQGDSPEAAQALEQLCRAYWDPLYAFVRRRGYKREDAEDLTQGFFALLLARNDFAAATPDRGRFRSFLLGALKHFMANEWRKQRAEIRGNGQTPVSLDGGAEGEGPPVDPADPITPELLYDQRWAVTILHRVIERLRHEFEVTGNADLFQEIKEFLSEKQPTAHKDVAARLGLTANAVGVAIHRMRQRYGQLIREEIRNTVDHPEDVESELNYLISVLGRGPVQPPDEL